MLPHLAGSAFIFLILAGLVIAFSVLEGMAFLSGDNFLNIAVDASELLLLAVGVTFVIITAGIDLSVGSVLVLSSVIAAQTMVGLSGTDQQVQNYTYPNQAVGIPVGIAAGLLTGLGCGLINGLLVTQLRLPPFIVTLGTLNIAFALTHIYSKDQTISNLPGALTWMGTTFKLANTAVAWGSILMLLLFALTFFLLRQTAGGRHVYAVGDNPEAARLTGIHTSRLLLAVYTLAGLLYGIAALLLIGYANVGDPQAGQTDNLDSITAVVLGGTSLFGGRGSVIGTLIGALIVGIVRNGLQLMGVRSIYQVLITGILVILAVAVDQLARRRQAR